jgi:fumarate reductase subunit D
MAKRSLEPVLWLLFSAGGVASALFVPILVLLFGLAFPFGWLSPPSYERMHGVLTHPITRLVLFGVLTLSLIHGAHRFRFTLYDGLQIKHLNELINLFCYGGAIALSVWAGYLLWRVA